MPRSYDKAKASISNLGAKARAPTVEEKHLKYIYCNAKISLIVINTLTQYGSCVPKLENMQKLSMNMKTQTIWRRTFHKCALWDTHNAHIIVRYVSDNTHAIMHAFWHAWLTGGWGEPTRRVMSVNVNFNIAATTILNFVEWEVWRQNVFQDPSISLSVKFGANLINIGGVIAIWLILSTQLKFIDKR